MKCVLYASLWRRRFPLLITAASILILSSSLTLSLWAAEGDQALPLGDPPVLEHPTPNGVTKIAQRLIRFPFTPPDVKLKEKEALSGSNDWFTKHDKNKIDQLGSIDFYASSGPQSVGVVPKLHNTSAGVEIYQLPSTVSKETFEKTEGPYRPGR